MSFLFLQGFFIGPPCFGIETDEQHICQFLINRQGLLCFPYGYSGSLFFRETIDTGADGREGNGAQVIIPGELEAPLVTAGQQILLP